MSGEVGSEHTGNRYHKQQNTAESQKYVHTEVNTNVIQ